MAWKVTFGEELKVTVTMAKSRLANTELPYLACVEN